MNSPNSERAAIGAKYLKYESTNATVVVVAVTDMAMIAQGLSGSLLVELVMI